MRLRAAAVAVAATTAVVPAAAPPAHAAWADLLIVTGAGTISPGLTEVPRAQSISFSGAATAIGSDGIPATWACAWSATGLNDTVAAGFGSASGSCGPVSFSSCQWTREGTDVQIFCVDPSGKALHGRFVFQPGNVNPITRFTLAGTAVASGV
ncbi:MAG TPA: hypothetical protein VF519_05010 [Mycobacteriales bacterium]